MIDAITFLWTQGLLRPMINALVFLYSVLFSNMGLSIIAFTIFIRVLTTPLTIRQVKQMRSMSLLQPRLKALREKHKGDSKKMSQETMRIYKEAGVNPLGCLGPLVIQLPIWIALFQALIRILPTNPDTLVGLSTKFYVWMPLVHEAIPLDPNFLWMNLAEPDPTNLIMPLLVGASTWAQQRMTTSPSTDPRQAQTNTMMLWMMPIMLGLLSMTFPSGLALYWTISNLVGIGTQYFITGWDPLFGKKPVPIDVKEDQPEQEDIENGKPGKPDSESEEHRGGDRSGHARTRRRPRRDRGRNSR